MSRRRQKRIALGALTLGLGVFAVAAFASRERLREEYWLWRLRSGAEDERQVAAEKLARMRSVRAVRPLIELTLVKAPLPPGGNIVLGSSALLPDRSIALGRYSPLFERLERGEYFWKFPRYPARALITIGRPAIPELLEALQEDRFCEAVQQVLGLMGPEAREAVPALKSLPDDPVDGGILVRAVLERIGGAERELPPLIRFR